MFRSICTTAFLVGMTIPSFAAVPAEMIGKWRWQDFTVAVSECQPSRLCAKIIAGPKNIGMEIFASALTAKGADLFGKIVDPKTNETYNTRFQKTGPDSWQLDGCTEMRVCLSGEFVRVK